MNRGSSPGERVLRVASWGWHQDNFIRFMVTQPDISQGLVLQLYRLYILDILDGPTRAGPCCCYLCHGRTGRGLGWMINTQYRAVYTNCRQEQSTQVLHDRAVAGVLMGNGVPNELCFLTFLIRTSGEAGSVRGIGWDVVPLSRPTANKFDGR